MELEIRDPGEPSSTALIDAQIPPCPKCHPAGFSPTVRGAQQVGPAGQKAGPPPRDVPEFGVTHPGPADCSRQRQQPKCHLPRGASLSPPSLGM